MSHRRIGGRRAHLDVVDLDALDAMNLVQPLDGADPQAVRERRSIFFDEILRAGVPGEVELPARGTPAYADLDAKGALNPQRIDR